MSSQAGDYDSPNFVLPHDTSQPLLAPFCDSRAVALALVLDLQTEDMNRHDLYVQYKVILGFLGGMLPENRSAGCFEFDDALVYNIGKALASATEVQLSTLVTALQQPYSDGADCEPEIL